MTSAEGVGPFDSSAGGTIGAPRVCALGGGHGLATTLRAMRTYAGEVTAVVSVADDGGSSGRIRQAIGGPAPGDLRRCFEALGDASMLTAEMGWRFGGGELAGHALGNLLIAGLVAAADDVVTALDEVGRMVGSAGRVLPATSVPVDLVADTGDWEVEGQVAVHRAEGVVGVRLVPENAPAPLETVGAIRRADQVVLGPGSFLTSVLAATLAVDVRSALRERSGPLVLVGNLVADREGPADLADHVRLLAEHGLELDVLLVDDGLGRPTPAGLPGEGRVVAMPVAGQDGRTHDPVRLGRALADLLEV
ncbi:MAG: uridine diphosphate-N-acetylglucosamine-binding protein YvcK [Actinomycetota bacterium]|nr:uridine diphosphate-N-acetylglucosamine-binding protein YvcK [Actinomycetota bacterium]